jgi:hypothetical protein
MAIISRQTGLLAAENWKKIYQTFREADFTTYDFETLRKSMIDYIKLYYPEDFNDFTESSEFVALIDLIAFMGQNLAFRTDLNARENFIDTAERRESILKLAKLVSYNPKRNVPASGYLKIESVSTTESLFDSNGFDLSNTIITWNDPANDNWLEQFTTILNASLVGSQIIGKPAHSQVINGIITDEYSINNITTAVPIFRFESTIEDTTSSFEVVSGTSLGKTYIYESAPDYEKAFNILYRTDNNGNSSNSTGFFFYFKQGEMSSFDFNIAEAVPNKVVSIDINNINNTDVWLYKLNTDGTTQSLWSAVPSTTGINIIYNKVEDRNLYQIGTRTSDQINLTFGDGSFSNVPQGDFRLYYRTSNGLSYKITPDEMRSIAISIRYISRKNRPETVTIRASLKYTVVNAVPTESTDAIRQKAPQQYYTQNRMITGEDYNILPYTSFSNIIKAKSINRTSSGLSRYLDMLDTTGKYSSTNTFGQDGAIYTEDFINTFSFGFLSANDVRKIVYNQIINKIIPDKRSLHYYYKNLTIINSANSLTPATALVTGRRYIINKVGVTDFTLLGASRNAPGVNFIATDHDTRDPNYFATTVGQAIEASISWHLSTVGSNSSNGYFIGSAFTPLSVRALGSVAKYLRPGAIIRFVAPNGSYFNAGNNLITGAPVGPEDKLELYAAIVDIIGDGTNDGLGNFTNGSGPVSLNTKIPTGAIIKYIVPAYKTNFGAGFTTALVNNITSYKNFAILYNSTMQNWQLASPTDISNDKWSIKFDYSNENGTYLVSYKGINYIFYSPMETTFYYDQALRVYDSKTASVIYDHIKILGTNPGPDSPMPIGKTVVWDVLDKVTNSDGTIDSSRIYITYSDSDNDGVPDDPNIFNLVVNPELNPISKLVFFELTTSTGYTKYVNLDILDLSKVTTQFSTRSQIVAVSASYSLGDIFYAPDDDAFYSILHSKTENANYVSERLTKYKYFTGRQNLNYQYRHNSPNTRRIDPSVSNIIDIYLLTSAYDTDYRAWINDTSNSIDEPSPPTSTELSLSFSGLNEIKSISDTVVFQNAIYKPIFGLKAINNLQAIFKVVKNPNLNISDADIKVSVINAINDYFSIDNWDFGETFYFSELSAYLHQILSPNIASIIIVPRDSTIKFGTLYQINAEANEIIISAATVENVEIISAVTAMQLNQGVSLTY